MHKTTLVAPLVALSVVTLPSSATPPGQDDILARSERMYASLKSYADTGTVVYQFGPESENRHAFKTYFRAPRHWYFDFTEDKRAGGHRFVLWGEGQDFQTWWSETGVHQVYPKGQGKSAINSNTYDTLGAQLLIASLVFPAAGIVSTLSELTDMTPAGTEPIGGRPAYKLVGMARSVYPSGHVSNIRRAAVWIDTETLLIRKVFEEATRLLPGSVMRTTVTFDPQANPSLHDSRFKFTPPSIQK